MIKRYVARAIHNALGFLSYFYCNNRLYLWAIESDDDTLVTEDMRRDHRRDAMVFYLDQAALHLEELGGRTNKNTAGRIRAALRRIENGNAQT